jgi:hypothetical protein
MERPKKIALMAFIIIVAGYSIYKLIRYIVIKRANVVAAHYNKTFDLCRVITKCSDHSYTDPDKYLPGYITGKEASKKNCGLTKTDISWRKDFKCQYDDINSISNCYDCLDGGENEEGIFECSLRKHDIDEGGSILPNYHQCLNMMGTSEMLDKDEIKRSYSFNISDLNDDERKYRGLTNEWWDKHNELYKCLTSHPDYLNDNWDTDYYAGYGIRSRMRLTSCSACFNAHGDNKDDYKRCMDEQSVCFRDNWPDSGPNCDLTYDYA